MIEPFTRTCGYLTGPTAKELVREVQVPADGTMDVDLYEGRTIRATTPPQKQTPRGPC